MPLAGCPHAKVKMDDTPRNVYDQHTKHGHVTVRHIIVHICQRLTRCASLMQHVHNNAAMYERLLRWSTVKLLPIGERAGIASKKISMMAEQCGCQW